jgi:SAM-dependent methyltransferase
MDYAFQDLKKELLKGLHGRVLDVGCGDGNWLRYFSKASFVTELEPNPHLTPQIERNVKLFKEENPQVEVEVTTKFAGDLDPAKPYDYIVFGNVMCEVPDQHAFLRDIDAVLKPGGKVVFMEHIRYPRGTMAGIVQDVGNVWWSCASDGCNCNRDTVDVMRSVKGWNVEFWDLEQDGFGLLDRMALGIISKEPSVVENDASDLVSKF